MTLVNLTRYKKPKSNGANSQLEMELSRLNKEAKTELRMHDTEKQRFRKKYSKLDVYNDNPIIEASDIRMYETHIPGFCYKSDGQCRCPPVTVPNIYVDFQDIHALLFTNGELDVEKVLCLHVLSTHKIDSLTPPPKRYNFFLPKKMLPIERLIERSKKRLNVISGTSNQADRLIKTLPFYVLDTQQPKEKRMNDLQSIDARLQSKLLVNDKLMELVRTVLIALQQSNRRRFRKVLRSAKDEKLMLELLTSPRIQRFAGYLKGLNLVTSCEAFHLTNPPKKPIRELTIATQCGGQLEDLIRCIRKNVFQIPEASSRTGNVAVNAEDLERRPSNDDDVDDDNDVALEYELVSHKFDHDSDEENRDEQGNEQDREEYGLDVDESMERFLCEDETITNRPLELRINRREKTVNVIVADEEANNKKSSVDSLALLNLPEQSAKLVGFRASETVEETEIDENTDLVRVAQTLNRKVKELATRDRKAQNLFYFDYEEPTSNDSPSGSSHQGGNRKLLRCAACKLKWQEPYPQPKVSQLAKVYVPKLDEKTDSEINTESLHKLSKMIDRGYARINEQRKSSSQNGTKIYGGSTSFSSTSNRRTTFMDGYYSTEVVQLKDIDLATIRQEIKEKEAQKKFVKFFKSKRS